MDLSGMLSNATEEAASDVDARKQNHQYPTRHTATSQDAKSGMSPYATRPMRGNMGAVSGTSYARGSPAKRDQKHVVFQLIDPEDPRIQARLPMRVMISHHDTTDSIITTVKNFYGLYEFGVSFENKDGISIIAAYDNFDNDMTVYVRTVAQPSSAHNERARETVSPRKPTLGAPFEMRPPQYTQAHSPSRSARRSAGVRSMSPQSDLGGRSLSAAAGPKTHAHASKSRGNSVHGDADGHSSDEGGDGSVTSSRRSKTELVNAEISVDNIVEGGRRKRAFESSELPLFVPPQVPMSASISSISPQRRNAPGHAASPYAYPNQQTFSYTQPLPSPQSYGGGFISMQPGINNGGYGTAYAQPQRQLRGGRPGGVSYLPSRQATNGILPTPDPTVGSVISDEDVALQLMRLGDASNFSSHGRTSTSTVDDALSGKAEAPSSDEDDEEGEEDEEEARPAVPRWPKNDIGPQRKKQRVMHELLSDATSGEEYEDHRDASFEGNSDEIMPDGQLRPSKTKSSKARTSLPPVGMTAKSGKPRSMSMAKPKSKSMSHMKAPMSPSSMPPQSRKASIASTINFQQPLGTDEEDLSSKPRCQRCRKSKKGCDRQRPCGRCKDAGIGAEGCISEDEGNGRKGRYGRHMGVAVKQADEVFRADANLQQANVPSGGYFLAPAPLGKEKKRKR